MSSNRAEDVGLRLVPEADPRDAVAHLSMVYQNSCQTFGFDHPQTLEISQLLTEARKRT